MTATLTKPSANSCGVILSSRLKSSSCCSVMKTTTAFDCATDGLRLALVKMCWKSASVRKPSPSTSSMFHSR